MGVIDGLQRPVTPAHTGWGDEAVGGEGWLGGGPLCQLGVAKAHCVDVYFNGML